MSKELTTLQQWRRHHFEVEKEYARRIVATPKESEERRRLIQEAYDRVVGDIIEKYDPSGGETSRPRVVTCVVSRLAPEGARVFDVGCGSGGLVGSLIQAGYQASGIDVSRDCIERARARLRPLAFEGCVEQADILGYETEDRFDCIVMDNVVEHIVPDSLRSALVKCQELLNKDGHIVILTPHRFAGPHDVSKYFLPLGAKAEGFHFKEFSFADIERELRAAGFSRVLGFPFHPRLLGWFGLIPSPSRWAARKAVCCERWLERPPLSKILTMDRALTLATLAILSPAVAVGVKRG
jgi:2-polyprenyl-3-methyl-5-hydroxy-6-metoxy-1,4-benzoquinol methylase